jgi:hypothetical protein
MELDVMEQLIIKALKSACGNKNIKFQIIIQDNQLHIYGNHRPEYQPNYSLLETNVLGAIASLRLDKINSLWLYARPLSQIEPNWQVFIELPTEDTDEIGDTQSNLEQLELDILDIEAELETELDSITDIEGIGNFDLMTSGTTGDARLLLDQIDTDKQDKTFSQQAIKDVDLDVVNSSQASLGYSSGDTGLLQEQGLIHGRPLKEVEINTFIASTENSAENSTEVAVSPTHNKLAQYCFISTSESFPKQWVTPSRTVIRLVKFFHHLSAEDQLWIAPIIENYLRLGVIDPGAEILPASQNWLTKITALDAQERSTFAWWLSCYCADPAATLDEFKTISAQNAAEMNIKQVNRVATYGFVPVKDDAPDSSNLEPLISLDQKLEKTLNQPKFKLPPRVKKLLLPGIWILGTMILIMIAIISQNSKMVTASLETPAVCQNTIGSVEYCRLAVNLAGERAIAQEPKNLFPLTEVTETVATYGCERYANLKAGMAIAKIDPKTSSVISSQGSKIFPHIYVVTAEQKNANQLGTTKVGCVYTTGQAQRSPKKLAADLIPLNWQQKQYTEQDQLRTEKSQNLSFGNLTKPINLGLATIFGAVGIAIAAWLNLGLKIHHSHTIYLVALMLGMVQLGNTLFMPNNFWGLLGAIGFPILTILTASLFLKDFQLPWQRGYPSIAITISAIVAIQFLLYSLSLGLIASLI